jgi:hypothetical protein
LTFIAETARHPGGWLFGAGHVEFPEAYVKKIGPNQAARDIMGGILKSVGASAESEKEISLGEHTGVEFSARFTIQGLKGYTRNRIYLVGNRAYVVMILGVVGQAPTEREIDRFLRSFQLLSGHE